MSHKLFFGTRLTEVSAGLDRHVQLTNIQKLINAVGNRQRCDNAALWSSLRSSPLEPEMDSSHARLFEILESLPDILGLWDRIKTIPEQDVNVKTLKLV